jgi:hypothetical protein
MTALCAGLALVPIALGMSKRQRDSGLHGQAIFFGLLTSTALNMVVVPAAYYRFGMRSVASLVRIFRSVDCCAQQQKSLSSSPNFQVAV